MVILASDPVGDETSNAQGFVQGAPRHSFSSRTSNTIYPVPEYRPVGQLSIHSWQHGVDHLQVAAPPAIVTLYAHLRVSPPDQAMCFWPHTFNY